MDMIAISLGVVVAGAVGAYLTRPWWTPQHDSELGRASASLDDPDRTLNERHEQILSALRDLDFDHEVGKLTAEDYGLLRQSLLAEAVAVLTQLDESRAGEADLDEKVEARILAVRRTLWTDQRPQADLPGTACFTCGRPIRPGDLYCGGCGAHLASACPSCGNSVQPSDSYCAGCGVELALALSG